MNTQSYWFNYHTQEFEARDAPETAADALDCLPQIPAAQGLYRVHRAKGEDIMESMRLTLLACVGEKSDQ